MSRRLHPAWLRVVAVVASYGVTFVLLLALPGAGNVAFALLMLPLAASGVLLGPLWGAGFGFLTGMLGVLFLLTAPSWLHPAWGPWFSVFFYMAIGAGFGLFQFRSPADAAGRGEDESWEHALDMHVRLDATGRVHAGNLRARTVFGQPNDLFDFVHPEDRARAYEQVEYAFARGEARWTMRVVAVNQRVIPVEAQLLRDGDWLSLEFHDLSEMFELERRLSETEARYRVLIEDAIDSLDAGIVILDRNREVIWANKALAHVLGLNQDWLVGRDLDRVIQEAAPKFDAGTELAKIVSGDEPKMTIALQNGHGKRTFAYNSIPISTERYQGGRIDYYYDITENKRLEEGLREQTELLKASNERLEAFTHVVSHDLKEPLRTLEMFSSYVLEDYTERLDEEGRDYLNSIGRAARRMKGLIDDLLELASIGRRDEPKELFNLGDVLDEVLHDLEASLGEVELALPEEYPAIYANRTRVGQLFANLISNGVKYNERERKRVELDWHKRGLEYVFTLRDNGIGIEQEYLDKVFELFERLNPHQDNFASTGAGLAICKRIVEEYGGKIWAESKLGEGSTFTFTFPKPTTKVVNQHETAQDLVG